MTALLVILLVIHVVPGVFWAGSTFTLARLGGGGVNPALGRAQAGAATVTVLAGVGLWAMVHAGPPSRPEFVLGTGALLAIAAAGVQQAAGWAALRKAPGEASALARFALAQRIASGLLAITIIAMVTFRYA